MNEKNRTDETYVLGQSSEAIQRLLKMGPLHNPFTQRLLEDAGVSRGMKVLDVGCGPGDVSLLAASLVGEEGSVLGIDTNASLLQLAQARAQAAGLEQVSFQAADIRDLVLDQKFDAIVGRLILQHLREPAALLRQLAASLRPGGLVAFQECDFTSHADAAQPHSPLLEQIWTWVTQAFQRAGVESSMGMKLYRTFREAGLPAPQLRYESPIGAGPEWGGYEVWAETLRLLMPLLVQSGMATAEEIGIETLADRLREEIVSQEGVARGPVYVSAWTRIGQS